MCSCPSKIVSDSLCSEGSCCTGRVTLLPFYRGSIKFLNLWYSPDDLQQAAQALWKQGSFMPYVCLSIRNTICWALVVVGRAWHFTETTLTTLCSSLERQGYLYAVFRQGATVFVVIVERIASKQQLF